MTSSKPLYRKLSKDKRTKSGHQMSIAHHQGTHSHPGVLVGGNQRARYTAIKRAGLPTWLTVKVPRKPSHLFPIPCQEGSQLHRALLCPPHVAMAHVPLTYHAHTIGTFSKRINGRLVHSNIYTFIYRCMFFLLRQSLCAGRTQTHSDLCLSLQGRPKTWPSTGPIKYFKSKKRKNNSS